MRSKKKQLVLLLVLLPVAVFSLFMGSGFGKLNKNREELSPLLELSKSIGYTALIGSLRMESTLDPSFSFVVLGDSRSNGKIAKQVFSSAAGEIPAFILHSGDLVSEGTVAEYLNYYVPLLQQAAPVPVIPIPGNHEKGPQKDFAGFRALYGADRVSFDYSECRFVGVNNGDSDGLSADDLKFLKEELSKPGAKYKFVLMHIPPVFVEDACSGAQPGPRGFTLNADAFRNLVNRMGVQEVFLGHNHGYASAVIDGVRYTITAGAGANLHTELAWLGSFHHYVVVRVEPERLRRELVRLDGDKWVRTEIQ
ncbi:MAG: metallophosphoesterase family protein [Syntrophobacteraceae bacterium]